MTKGTHIIGLDIISIKTGKKLETVTDILYDPRANKIIGLLVDKGDWFSDSRIILTQNIISVGKDAVMVEDENSIQTTGEVSGRVNQIANGDQTLQKNKVITEAGENLGSVSDIYVDFPGGSVMQLEVSKGLFGDIGSGKSLVLISDIMTIGEDTLIVKNYTKEIIEEQAKTGGLQGIAKTTGEKTGKFVEGTKEFMSQKGEELSHRAQEIGNSVQEKTAPIIDKTKEKTGELIEASKEKIHQAKEYSDSGNLQRDFEGKIDQTKKIASDAGQNISQKTTNLAAQASNQIDKTKSEVSQKAQHVGDDIKRKQIQEAVGKRVVRIHILDKKDNILARPGDLVTNELIKLAIENEVIDQLLANCE